MATNYTFSSELFFEELLRVSGSIVWKNETVALKCENEEDMVTVEQYTLARQGRLSFESVFEFAEEVLRSFNMSDEDVINCMDDKYRIPIDMRDMCAERQSEWLIDNYEEHNNYYRMLHGLPNMDDTDFFYNTIYPDISDSTTPIHELPSSAIRLLEVNGYLDKLIKENPSKKYLQHMTDKKIDIYKARNSAAFSILWITSSDSDNMIDHFMDTYNEARGMIMNVFYQKMMSVSNTEYTGFIGMMILFQTIMLMHKNFLDADITRDFYDVESLRLVYDSYDVPFYQNIPLEYHKKIVKNINILLSHKGSTRVFYDLFDIFGFNDIALYSFYMVKKRRLGNNGKPIFAVDKDGNPDRQKMYDIDFAKVPLYGDPLIEIRDVKNQVRYEELTMNDKYWFTDKYLLDKIFDEEFNYMESKYIGIQLTSNLMQIIYETTYYLKMILDNRELLVATTIYNSALHSDMNIFDMVIYLSALVTKKYGYEGNIPRDPHEIGSVLGFNFKLDLEVLQKNIRKDDILKKDKRLLTLLETMDVSSLESVRQVYTNLTTLRKYLVKKMSATDNVDEYWAYHRLYESIMYSEYTEETFRKSNGEVASSFADMLSDINPLLYSRYLIMEELELNNEIVNMLYLAKSSCTSLKYIQYADSINMDVIIEYLFKLLDFFKSAKADLTGYEIIYSLISSADNIMKLMSYVDRIYDDHTEQPIYSIFDELTDMIAWIKDRTNLCDKYKLIDDLPYIFDTTVVKSIIEYLEDYIKKCTDILYELVDSTQFVDWVHGHREISILEDDPLKIKDQLFVLYEELKDVLRFRVFDEFPLFDDLLHITDKYIGSTLDEKFEFLCKISIIFEAQKLGDSKYTITDDIELHSKEFLESRYMLIDEIIRIYKEHNKVHVDITTKDVITFISKEIELDPEDRILLDLPWKVREMFLIAEDIKNNRLLYKDELYPTVMRYYLDHSSYTLKDDMKSEDITEMESAIPYLADFFYDHRDISIMNDELTLGDQLFSLIDDSIEYTFQKVIDKLPIIESVISIYKDKSYAREEFPMDSIIESIKTIVSVDDMYRDILDYISDVKEISILANDISENKFGYLTQLSVKLMKYFMDSEYTMQDELSKKDFTHIKSIIPQLQDYMKTEKEKVKADSSQMIWGEKLYLVYEEHFEDD